MELLTFAVPSLSNFVGNGDYKLGLRVTTRGRKYKLGLWVTTQRRNRRRMSKERRQRLETIGFVWQQKTERKKAPR